MNKSNWLVAEEVNLKIFAIYELKHFQVPMRSTLFTDVNLIEHYKQIRVQWCTIDVGYNGINVEEDIEEHNDVDILDDIGIMNLENAMDKLRVSSTLWF